MLGPCGRACCCQCGPVTACLDRVGGPAAVSVGQSLRAWTVWEGLLLSVCAHHCVLGPCGRACCCQCGPVTACLDRVGGPATVSVGQSLRAWTVWEGLLLSVWASHCVLGPCGRACYCQCVPTTACLDRVGGPAAVSVGQSLRAWTVWEGLLLSVWASHCVLGPCGRACCCQCGNNACIMPCYCQCGPVTACLDRVGGPATVSVCPPLHAWTVWEGLLLSVWASHCVLGPCGRACCCQCGPVTACLDRVGGPATVSVCPPLRAWTVWEGLLLSVWASHCVLGPCGRACYCQCGPVTACLDRVGGPAAVSVGQSLRAWTVWEGLLLSVCGQSLRAWTVWEGLLLSVWASHCVLGPCGRACCCQCGPVTACLDRVGGPAAVSVGTMPVLCRATVSVGQSLRAWTVWEGLLLSVWASHCVLGPCGRACCCQCGPVTACLDRVGGPAAVSVGQPLHAWTVWEGLLLSVWASHCVLGPCGRACCCQCGPATACLDRVGGPAAVSVGQSLRAWTVCEGLLLSVCASHCVLGPCGRACCCQCGPVTACLDPVGGPATVSVGTMPVLCRATVSVGQTLRAWTLWEGLLLSVWEQCLYYAVLLSVWASHCVLGPCGMACCCQCGPVTACLDRVGGPAAVSVGTMPVLCRATVSVGQSLHAWTVWEGRLLSVWASHCVLGLCGRACCCQCGPVTACLDCVGGPATVSVGQSLRAWTVWEGLLLSVWASHCVLGPCGRAGCCQCGPVTACLDPVGGPAAVSVGTMPVLCRATVLRTAGRPRSCVSYHLPLRTGTKACHCDFFSVALCAVCTLQSMTAWGCRTGQTIYLWGVHSFLPPFFLLS